MSTARTVVVTGAAGGIGSEIVDRFLSNGDTVVAGDLSPSTLDAWRARWDSTAPGGKHEALYVIPVDIANEESVAAMARAVQERVETVDVLINNAGHFPQTPFEKVSSEEWRRVIDINLTGAFHMIQAFVPLMKASGRGRIVSIGSGSFFSGVPLQSHYVASKGGVMGLTRVLARELGEYGITVNLIAPGFTITPAAVAAVPDSLPERMRMMRSIQRDEVPADLVGPIFFLASEDAAFMTGQTLNVDGGLYML